MQDALHHSTPKAYSFALFWSLTNIIGLGSDPQTPATMLELWYIMFVITCGVFIFASIVGNIWSLISSTNAALETWKTQMDSLNIFMFKRKVPSALKKRIHNYFEYLLSKDGMDDNLLLGSLPEHLRYDLSLFLNRDVIRKVPFFGQCEPGFIKRLTIHLIPQLYSPQDWILRAGEIGDCMYFISKGVVEVLSQSEERLTVQGDGQFFGEIALLFKCTRTASVRAITYTHVFILKKEDLDKTLKEYPQYISKIQDVAKERLSKTQTQNLVFRNTAVNPLLGTLRGNKDLTLSGHQHNLDDDEEQDDFDWVFAMEHYVEHEMKSMNTSRVALAAVQQKMSVCLEKLNVEILARKQFRKLKKKKKGSQTPTLGKSAQIDVTAQDNQDQAKSNGSNHHS